MITSNFRKKMADSWFSYLQSQICKEFEILEKNKVKKTREAELHFYYQKAKFLIK